MIKMFLEEWREAHPAKVLPQNLTSYDLLKAAAVIIMIIDHMGFYFFQHESWWRAVGRIGFPIWFFLIGYARSRDFSPKLWFGAALLLGANLVSGMFIFPLNALFSMIFMRVLLDRLMVACVVSLESLMMITGALLIVIVPSYVVCEYGTQGLILAMFGYIIRNRPQVGDIRNPNIIPRAFGLICLAQFIVTQGLFFTFPLPQLVVMSVGLGVVFVMLYEFRPVEYPVLTQKLPGFLSEIIRFLGRRTLEIYVAHLILFKILGIVIDPVRFHAFHWTLTL